MFLTFLSRILFLLLIMLPPIYAAPAYAQSNASLFLGVDNIDIIIDYRNNNDDPYIDDRISPSAAESLNSWATKVLMAGDDSGNLLISITKASLKEEDIAEKKGLSSFFVNEQRYLVTAEFEAIFSFAHPKGNRSATVVVSSTAENSIPDSTTPAAAADIRRQVVTDGIVFFEQELRRRLENLSKDGWPLLPPK